MYTMTIVNTAVWQLQKSREFRLKVLITRGKKIFFLNLFIIIYFFWLRWVFVAACRLSLVVASGGYSLLWGAGFSLPWLLLLQSTGSRRPGFISCGTRAQ